MLRFITDNQTKTLIKRKNGLQRQLKWTREKYWMYRQQSLILAELNEKEAAVAAAKVSLKLADEAGNKDYVRLNTKAIEEWSK